MVVHSLNKLNQSAEHHPLTAYPAVDVVQACRVCVQVSGQLCSVVLG